MDGMSVNDTRTNKWQKQTEDNVDHIPQIFKANLAWVPKNVRMFNKHV